MTIEQKGKYLKKIQLHAYWLSVFPNQQWTNKMWIKIGAIDKNNNNNKFAYCCPSCFFNSFTFYIAILLPFICYSWTTCCPIDAANNISSNWWSWLVNPMSLLLSFPCFNRHNGSLSLRLNILVVKKTISWMACLQEFPNCTFITKKENNYFK